LDLEGLRLCFVDRDTRIRQPFEYQRHVFPRIIDVNIKGGFLDGVKVPFHEGLNCVLGAKGAGKSLLIEFMRFALNQEPTQKGILDDHEQKLEERLRRYSEVSLTVIDDTGKQFAVTRVYNPPAGNPYKE
jgi:energy-coupling factor transporter ATP-binding protein EcfA2